MSTKRTYTDLNYDLMHAENFTLSEGDELINYSWKVRNENTFTDDFNMFQEENGYYSLHHGYTHIRCTYTDKNGLGWPPILLCQPQSPFGFWGLRGLGTRA